jgi:nicotinamide-nucleotide amidase
LACGTADNVMTCKIEEDNGRDVNLTIATNKAVQMFCSFLKAEDASAEG